MSMVFLGMTHCKKCWAKLDGEIGLCESCRQAEERENKSSEQVSKSEGKYKLIDILNKIADGELKEGTQIIWDVYEYTYKKGDCYDEYLERKVDKFNYVDIIDDMALRHLNAEVELIEPHHIRDDTKIIEPTDNTTEKIEELECGDKYGGITARIINKLNEVIRKLNKEDNNE